MFNCTVYLVRKFTKEYKLAVLDEVKNNPRFKSEILKKHGLTSTYLKNWMKELNFSIDLTKRMKRFFTEEEKLYILNELCVNYAKKTEVLHRYGINMSLIRDWVELLKFKCSLGDRSFERRNFSVSCKLKILEETKQKGLVETSRIHNVPTDYIKKWAIDLNGLSSSSLQ